MIDINELKNIIEERNYRSYDKIPSNLDLIKANIKEFKNEELNKLLQFAIEGNNEKYGELIKLLLPKVKENSNYKFIKASHSRKINEEVFGTINHLIISASMFIPALILDHFIPALILDHNTWQVLAIGSIIFIFNIVTLIYNACIYYSNRYDNAYDYAKAEGYKKALDIIETVKAAELANETLTESYKFPNEIANIVKVYIHKESNSQQST